MINQELLLYAATAFLPVVVLLLIFDTLDVFEFMRKRDFSKLILSGALLATPAYFINDYLLDAEWNTLFLHVRLISPFIEELLKALPLILMFHYNRLGYKLDAGLAGFAVGAGFAVSENAWFLFAHPDSNLSAWIIRGFGTAIMHGGSTALMAVASDELLLNKDSKDARTYRFNPFVFIPGIVGAIVLHGFYNHFATEPWSLMVITMVVAPALLFVVFLRDEKVVNKWLAIESAEHKNLLISLENGTFYETPEHNLEHLPEDTRTTLKQYLAKKVEMLIRGEDLITAKQMGIDVDVGDKDRQIDMDLQKLLSSLPQDLVQQAEPWLGLSRHDLWELSRYHQRVIRHCRK